MPEPVFYDPQRARWKRLRRLVDVVVGALSALIIFFAYTTLRDERLPELLFSPQKRACRALKENEKDKARERQKKLANRSHRKSKLAASEVKLNQEEGIRAAFYVPWDAASFSSLRDYSRQIDLLYPEWLHVLTGDMQMAVEQLWLYSELLVYLFQQLNFGGGDVPVASGFRQHWKNF